MDTLQRMAKQKPKPDRHKSRMQASIREHFVEPAEKLVKRLGLASVSELVNIALREKLEREGFWPPKES